MKWHNPPPRWTDSAGILTVETGDQTDFWRETHYGFIRDTGHFFHREVAGDFTATVRFSGEYRALYDQAGMMVRLDERHWLKAGVEYTDGLQHLSVVMTRGYSDWSVLPLTQSPDEVTLRLSRHGDAVRVEYALAGSAFRMLRLAYFPPGLPVSVGPMACSPQRSGFVATFRDFQVGPPISRELHAGE